MILYFNYNINKFMNVSDFDHTIYYANTDFAHVRKEILKEDNWLRDNW